MELREITPVLLTYNEACNVSRSVGALVDFPEVLIVDSFSTDATIEIAQRTHSGVWVEQRAFTSFADQCNFGLSLITTDWVLSIDADYIINPALVGEIRQLEPSPHTQGYSAAFRYCIHGHPLRSTLYPRRVILYRGSNAMYENEGHGHRVRINGSIEYLRNQVDHDDRKPLGRWILSQVRYAEIEAPHLLQTPDRVLNRADRLRKRIFYAAPAVFIYLLFGRGLILDGWRGWFYVAQRAIAELLLSLRLLLEKHRLELGK